VLDFHNLRGQGSGTRTHEWNQLSSHWDSISVWLDLLIKNLGKAVLGAGHLDVSTVFTGFTPSASIKVST
jgi:hypothetical protein